MIISTLKKKKKKKVCVNGKIVCIKILITKLLLICNKLFFSALIEKNKVVHRVYTKIKKLEDSIYMRIFKLNLTHLFIILLSPDLLLINTSRKRKYIFIPFDHKQLFF